MRERLRTRARASIFAGALAALAGAADAQFMTGRGLAPAVADPSQALSAKQIVDQVGFDQNLGAQLPLDLELRDESGRTVRLGDYFGERPVVIGFVYYRCPVLCTLIERGAAMAAKPLDLVPGRDYDVVFVSFDPTDTAEKAAEARARTLATYGREEGSDGWHFLTASPETIAALTGVAGFRYVFEEATGQYAHAAGLVVATPDGRLSRYLYGAEFAPRDLKLALVESSAGTIGGAVEKLMLFCFRYDAGLGRYTAVSMLALRVGAAAILVFLVLYFAFARRGRRDRRLAAGGLA
ncbi:MAG: photosynthetic protein synthase I [Acidobacteriota bacterium]